MSTDGSVAPKERVNIVYRPATGDAAEDVELPFKLLVVGDFTHREDERPVEDRDPINIDKDNFDDVLEAQNIMLQLAVPKRLAGAEEDENLDIQLSIKRIKDFEPDQLVTQIPEMEKLLALRDALKALKGPLSNVPEFRKKIHELIDNESCRDALLKEIGLIDTH